ncbi:MAG: ATP-dependent Clp protease ATP-binding subunit, partial [Deltaproteobacteria bacterium]|nr:ATP-dependent Clp protease ATP-binding subunit [Candidatus Tharpella sp.]
HGKLDRQKINIKFKLLHLTQEQNLSAGSLAQLVEIFQEFSQVNAPHPTPNGDVEIWVELQGSAELMGPTQEKAFINKVEKLKKKSLELQSKLTVQTNPGDLTEQYKPFAETLTPITPWKWKDPSIKPLWDWALETIDFLYANSSIALAGDDPVTISTALAILARVAKQFSTSLGSIILPQCGPEKLLQLVNSAPGAVVVPAIRISVGSHTYDFAKEIRALLTSLASLSKPVVFTGSMKELQEVFHGGQGGSGDPLQPVVRKIPEVPLNWLIRYAVREQGSKLGGLTNGKEQDICRKVNQILATLSSENSRSILSGVTARSIHEHLQKGASRLPPLQKFVDRLQGCTETLVGLPVEIIDKRSAKVVNNFTKTLSDPGLLAFFEEELIGQKDALAELHKRLYTEALTRPAHQPIRYCAQGTPGNGKSESTILLAQKLGIPYVNIDAASMTDFHTASAQLLGSSRGLVGSYQAGRLESIAREHQGAVVEISDLDHALPHVRAPLADLFLQLLESGEAQSASGARFSCANLILAFTINLPDGKDESVRRRFGFGPGLEEDEIRGRINKEIKTLFSSAFLSRIGEPILFRELDKSALAEITKKAAIKAIDTALERLGLTATPQVIIDDEVIENLLRKHHLSGLPNNARTHMELGRNSVLAPLLELVQSGVDLSGKKVMVGYDKQEVTIQVPTIKSQ